MKDVMSIADNRICNGAYLSDSIKSLDLFRPQEYVTQDTHNGHDEMGQPKGLQPGGLENRSASASEGGWEHGFRAVDDQASTTTSTTCRVFGFDGSIEEVRGLVDNLSRKDGSLCCNIPIERRGEVRRRVVTAVLGCTTTSLARGQAGQGKNQYRAVRHCVERGYYLFRCPCYRGSENTCVVEQVEGLVRNQTLPLGIRT